jgi:hypothetical protein
MTSGTLAIRLLTSVTYEHIHQVAEQPLPSIDSPWYRTIVGALPTITSLHRESSVLTYHGHDRASIVAQR